MLLDGGGQPVAAPAPRLAAPVAAAPVAPVAPSAPTPVTTAVLPASSTPPGTVHSVMSFPQMFSGPAKLADSSRRFTRPHTRADAF